MNAELVTTTSMWTALEKLAQRHRELAQGLNGLGECNDTSPNSTAKNSVENALIRLVDTDHKVQQEICSLAQIENEIRHSIAKLNDDDLESVLINRYLNFMTIEEIAESMHFSVHTVNKIINQGIKKMICFDME